MLSENEKRELLNSIVESPGFKDSKRYADLLLYLMEKSISGEHLKETTIAHEFFGRDVSFDPGKESFVRSYISGVRKRLDHYYLTLTEPVKYTATIPKGQYNIHFTPVEQIPEKKVKFTLNKRQLLIGSISFFVLICAFYFIDQVIIPHSSNFELLKNPVLANFVGTPAKKTIIALGDYFFFTDNKPQPDERTYLRNSDINNENDLQVWKMTDPKDRKKYEALNFTYFRPSTNLGLLKIVSRFNYESENFEVKSASALKWQDFEKSNVIFIGSIKTLYILDTLLLKTNFRYNVKTRNVSIIEKNGTSSKSFTVPQFRDGRYSEDCSIILKIPGSSRNSILILAGFGEVGVMGSVKIALENNFCDLIKTNFNTRLESSNQYFSLISKVTGVQQTVFNYNMAAFSHINTSE